MVSDPNAFTFDSTDVAVDWAAEKANAQKYEQEYDVLTRDYVAACAQEEWPYYKRDMKAWYDAYDARVTDARSDLDGGLA